MIRFILRSFLTGALVGAAATLLFAQSPTSTAPCPLPDNSSNSSTTATSSSDVQSPEQGEKKELLLHNGHQICVSMNAVPAHLKQGDKDLGPCTGGG